MKVLHLSSEASWRGGEQQIIYLVESSRRMGVDARVACRQGSPVAEYCQKKELPYYPMAFSSAYHLPTAQAIKLLGQKEQFDLLHLHTSKGHTLGLLAGLLGLKIPMILHRRVDFPVKKNPFSRWKYNHDQIRKIICVSDFVRKTLEPTIKKPEKLLTIYSSVDLSPQPRPKEGLKKLFHLPHDALLIGNTSALADHKDYPTFIRTAVILAKKLPKAHFLIMGEGPMQEQIEGLISENHLTDRVTLTGFLPKVRNHLPELDLFLFTSKTEGLGTSLLDAFAAGVPVVATAAGGIPEVVVHEQTGLLAQVGDSEQLARLAMLMLQNGELKSRVIKGGSEKVREFDREVMTKKVMDVYQVILAGRN